MKPAVAIVGMACRYPDAHSPQELWENVLSQRRSFRRIPQERLSLKDYYHPDPAMPDRTYSDQGAFIDDYQFDRVQFRMTGTTYRSSDLAHWLALDVASQALADAGFSLEKRDLPTEATGVLIGNTLTGELSRANSLRLRWPYVYRVMEAALLEEGWSAEQCQRFLRNVEASYKAPFAAVGEETLAGGLSNTIAGRICNYFDLHGGGYTVDGACSSSLLAVYHACSGLMTHDIDLALAGGVDVSLDPFELIGFAKTFALAPDEMRIFDRRSSGFLPGEGCGIVVLMRYEDAIAQHRQIYAVIRGWGISSDGNGGITRPEVEGERLAMARAYKRAGFGIETVPYFECHGTGTPVGDTTEIQALSLSITQALEEQSTREALRSGGPAFIGSVKANIGHTKAAAGIAGIIKAAMALREQIIPPTTGTRDPHQALARPDSPLNVLPLGRLWPADRPLRTAVSSLGFGGINAHIVLEGHDVERRTELSAREQMLLHSAQDAELFLFAASDAAELKQQMLAVLSFAERLSLAELGDLAAHLAQTVAQASSEACIRAACIASSPRQLDQHLRKLVEALDDGQHSYWDVHDGVFLAAGKQVPRIGFLFPGQGSPSRRHGGALRRRFPLVDELYQQAQIPQEGDEKNTDVAQITIITASTAAQCLLAAVGIEAQVAIGHSLGELGALHWAGAMDQRTLFGLAAARGRIMAALDQSAGAMISLSAPQHEVEPLLRDTDVVISGLNSPRQTTVAGRVLEVSKVLARAKARSIKVVRLPVALAFHSPLMQPSVAPFMAYMQHATFAPVQRRVISTATGGRIEAGQDLRSLLSQQITVPVRFIEAVSRVQDEIDLWIEVGPGKILSSLVADFVAAPVISTDASSASIMPFLLTVGAAFALGAPVKHDILFTRRFHRAFDLNWNPQFLVNPCEQVPEARLSLPLAHLEEEQESQDEQLAAAHAVDTTMSIVQQIIARKTELPLSAIFADSRLLSDLHLNSITVGQIVVEACRMLELPPSSAVTDYTDATVQTIAQALDDIKKTGHTSSTIDEDKNPPGIANWTRPFLVELYEQPITLVNGETQAVTPGRWRLYSPVPLPFTQQLQRRLASLSGDGIVLCIPHSSSYREQCSLLLQVAHEALASKDPLHIMLLQQEQGSAGFIRTLALEAPHHSVGVLTAPFDHPQLTDWVIAEIVGYPSGYHEASYDEQGKRYEPYLVPLHLPAVQTVWPLGTHDVLLVTGGGKGIAAECAISLAMDMGLRLILAGRSDPDTDRELSTNLRRLDTAGIEYRYIVGDVTDTRQLISALEEAQRHFGAITGIVHGAGNNTPRLLSELDEQGLQQTLAPKVQGLENILQALAANDLRLLVTFGSVIARTGMRGEADYALANDTMAARTQRYQQEHPRCRCLCVEWSVWSGVGMGERLDRIDALKRSGIMPIAPDEGIAVLKQLIAQPALPTRVIVGGRLAEQPTLKHRREMLPFLRFLEYPKIIYPGIELVAEADISLETDPYLADHRVQGEYIVPAVMGLEAMAQAAQAVAGSSALSQFKEIQLARPIIVPEAGSQRIRIVALVYHNGTIEVAIRCAETAFQVDHFRAYCTFEAAREASVPEPLNPQLQYVPELAVVIDPAADLYQRILFHQGRFQRLRRYYWLHATSCIAELEADARQDWFARYLPAQLILGDPAARDTVIHAIQACIPQSTLLPISVDQLTIYSDGSGRRRVYARERMRAGDVFVYDVDVLNEHGVLLEQWRGLHLRQMHTAVSDQPYAEALLGPYIERKVAEFFSGEDLHLVVHRHGQIARDQQSNEAAALLLGHWPKLEHRLDGKPLLGDDPARFISFSHDGSITLALCARTAVGVDIARVAPDPTLYWNDLLGEEHFKLATLLAREHQERIEVSATRVWGALECMKKVSGILDSPLTLDALPSADWVLLKGGPYRIASYRAVLPAEQRDVIITITCHQQSSENAIFHTISPAIYDTRP